MLPLSHTGDGLVKVTSISQHPVLSEWLHFLGWLYDDFYSIESTPYHISTDELVMEEAVATEGDPGGGIPSHPGPLFAGMEEAIFDVTGPLHFKV